MITQPILLLPAAPGHTDLPLDHSGDHVPGVDVQGDEGTQHGSGQLGQFAAHYGGQLVQVLESGERDVRVRREQLWVCLLYTSPSPRDGV